MINSINKTRNFILFSLSIITLITSSGCKDEKIIEHCDSQFYYEGSPFNEGDKVTINPTYTTGENVEGQFSSTSGLVFLDNEKGTIDIEASAPGTYMIRKAMLNNPTCGGRIQFAELTIEAPVKPVVFNDAESLENWNFSGPAVLDNEDKKQGSSSIKVNVGPGLILLSNRVSEPIDSKVTLETGEFRFWLYLSDADILEEGSEVGQIELTSSGGSDKNELTWGIVPEDMNFQNGWNELILKFSDAKIRGGEVNLSALNFFRLYMFPKAGAHSITIGLDDLKIQEIID